jgi:hypothetical protein
MGSRGRAFGRYRIGLRKKSNMCDRPLHVVALERLSTMLPSADIDRYNAKNDFRNMAWRLDLLGIREGKRHEGIRNRAVSLGMCCRVRRDW